MVRFGSLVVITTLKSQLRSQKRVLEIKKSVGMLEIAGKSQENSYAVISFS